jgi:hypothetical protein
MRQQQVQLREQQQMRQQQVLVREQQQVREQERELLLFYRRQPGQQQR